ncbi:hypothetical protein [Roseateles depolymerans]|uniref:Uncharacterized protein n=1 Tax=Roseateles depolymerans TaxID=76731 RepID=A0A0U3MWV6_9BURK|nr:hypothetical protein [Roseateles depolymerans]ALV07507.1 hypothetical protein RD2015_3046 [Roseateles depolymerans]REG22277.1 hypothetical protein DES44_1421 [Roseateles depolymerans]
MNRFIHWLTLLLKYACPLVVAAVPCVMAVGVFAPWPVAQQALGPSDAREAVLIAWSYSSKSSGNVIHKRREQSYVLVPTLRAMTVIEEDGQVRTEEDALSLVGAVVRFALACLGTWWFWLRKRSQGRMRAA